MDPLYPFAVIGSGLVWGNQETPAEAVLPLLETRPRPLACQPGLGA